MPAKQNEQLSDPKWWFEEIVEPNYKEYCHDPFSRRKAVNAIVTTYHFWERLYHFRKQTAPKSLAKLKNRDAFRDDLISNCPRLNLLRDVADATKHHLRERSPSAPFESLAQSSSAVTRQSPGGLEIDDTNILVEVLLRDVMGYWREVLSD